MSPTDIFALILVALIFLKLFLAVFFPKVRIMIGKKIYSTPSVTALISLLLAVIVGYFLLLELSIIQIFAVCLFFSFLMVVGFAPVGKEMMAVFEKKLNSREILKRNLLSIIVWLVLCIWVLVELFND